LQHPLTPSRRSVGGRTLKLGGLQGRGDPPLSRARMWHLGFDDDGRPCVWNGTAASAIAAVQQARADLAADHPDFDCGARLTVCVER
jgi:hypothetical protein